jgi:hypothetical protein
MLKKMFEWYRMVNPNPDNETIEKRKLAVMELIKRLSESKGYELIIACVCAAANGFDINFKQESEIVQAVVGSIHAHQPAFPADLSENALELRACCAIALGEILTCNENENKVPKEVPELVASLFVSATGIRPQTRQKYLRVVIQDLEKMSFEVLENIAQSRRQRAAVNYESLDKVPSNANMPTFWNELRPILKNYFSIIDRQNAADREELDVLWWLYNGFSETVNQPLITLSPAIAAICCGAEVADKVLIPPLESVRQMVLQATEKGRKESGLSAVPLTEMAAQWKDEILSTLIPSSTGFQEIIKRFPPLFPLSWLCLRLQESQGSSGWSQEFKLKTSISASQSWEPKKIAAQAFNERIAQRECLDLFEE